MSDAEVWCVLTMKDGAVSLLNGLTEDECRGIVQRIRGDDPWSQEAIHQRVMQSAGLNAHQQMLYAYQQQASAGFAMDRCEWWGSKNGKLVVWPKPSDYDARLAEAMKVLATVERTNALIKTAGAA